MTSHFSGVRVVAVVVAALALTVGLPPAAATALARWRVARAERTVVYLAGEMSRQHARVRETTAAETICGPGRLPYPAGPGAPWLQRSILQSPAYAAGWPADPWGRCYLFNVGKYLSDGSGLVLSAGTNGEVETPLDANAPAGDDIAATVR